MYHSEQIQKRSTCTKPHAFVKNRANNHLDSNQQREIIEELNSFRMSNKQPKSDEFIVSDTDSSSDSDADAKSRKADSRKKVKSLKKKIDRSSGSDESDNDEVIPKKKERKEKSNSDKEKHNSDPEDDKRTEWNLSKNRKIRLNEFRGKMLIDIREYYEADGEMKPGKKGISLTRDQWEALLSVASKVNDRLK